MDIGKLHAMRRILLNDGQDPIFPCLQIAAQFLRSTTSKGLLGCIVRHPNRRAIMRNIVSCLDHVGFVTFRHPTCDMESAAAAAGFDGRRWTFSSRIVARELGHLVGTDFVPTTIFKAQGTFTTGVPSTVEIFMPQAIDARQARGWIERGCAVHVGFTISNPKHFREIVRIMAHEGFQPPAFAPREPLTNDSEKMTALYLDGRLDGRALRIEFCHFSAHCSVAA